MQMLWYLEYTLLSTASWSCKFIFIGSMRFRISVLDSLPSTLLRRSIRRIMLACSGSRGPLNVRILLCNSSSLDSVDIVALAYLPGAFIIRVLVLTELRENVLQVDNSESESGLALTLSWGAVSKVPRVTSDADVYKGSVV